MWIPGGGRPTRSSGPGRPPRPEDLEAGSILETGLPPVHEDRGCQYTSQQFASLAGEFSVRLSVGRTGQCRDNALAESFFATIKRELLGTTAWPSRAAARTAIFDFIERPRCSIG
ncbi:integrase core domain-containing protein [Streptomyces sp. NPDC018352]|uniref:integrase core domain-containing protein n=1 Tax=Streptomyces sp. NPDC018352 TaxID=3157194 RepID=UPI0033D05B86